MPSPFAELFQPTQVLQKYRLNSDPKSRMAPILEMRGRPSGFLHAILHLFGLTPITDVYITSTEVYRHTRSLGGELINFMPLRAIQGVTVGISKPLPLLIVGILLLIGGLSMAAAVGATAGIASIFMGLVSITLFFMGQSYVLSFIGVGEAIAIKFKSGSDSKSRVDLDSLLDAVDVIRELLMDADQPGGSKTHKGVSDSKKRKIEEDEEDYDDE